MAAWLSWLEHSVHTRQIGGSTPLAATTKRNPFCLPRQERFFLAFGAKYSFAGQQTVAADSASLSITNPTVFESRPDIKLYGSGTVMLNISSGSSTTSWTISAINENIEIDSELMNCFKDTVLKMTPSKVRNSQSSSRVLAPLTVPVM